MKINLYCFSLAEQQWCLLYTNIKYRPNIQLLFWLISQIFFCCHRVHVFYGPPPSYVPLQLGGRDQFQINFIIRKTHVFTNSNFFRSRSPDKYFKKSIICKTMFFNVNLPNDSKYFIYCIHFSLLISDPGYLLVAGGVVVYPLHESGLKFYKDSVLLLKKNVFLSFFFFLL